MDSAPDAPLVVLTVGTDHHPFPRLIGWLDAWARDHPEVRCVIQHGMSPGPQYAEAVGTVAHATLIGLLGRASVIVSQAGPGSILDARRVGLVPIVVPRLSRLGEVVDDHQVVFADAMQRRGEVIVATSAAQVAAAVTRALADPSSVRRPPSAPTATRTAARVEEALLAVSSARPRWLDLAKVRDLARQRGRR